MYYISATSSKDKTKIFTVCRKCRKEFKFVVNKAAYLSWQHGAMIQDALTELSADERELLISGFCGDCFDKLTSDVLPLSRLSAQTPTTHETK